MGLLAVATTAGALAVGSYLQEESPETLHEGGIGPLVVDRDFEKARQAVFRAAPDTAFSGVGCAGLDEIRYDVELGRHAVGVMAMAENGQIREVEATLYNPSVTEDREACLALRNQFAQTFVQRFGPIEQTWQVNKPVSQELLARTGPVVINARWFSMGRSCYVSAHYGVLKGGSVRFGDSLAALADSS
jgi:hypothetical protein